MYWCLPDDYHRTKYYSDGKPASEEYDTNISQIYSMMRKREENFLIHSFEIDDTIYGICNVYSEQGDLLTLYTQNLKYSFSFRYAEKEDKLYKVHEYEDMELIYPRE